jgi:hypothetical protein
LCGGALLDSIINFGESLPEQAFNLAHSHAEKSDLCLVLGSSLTVTPASLIPQIVGKKRNASLAICNLQPTPFDDKSNPRVYCSTDELMSLVMENLSIPVPAFVLRRYLVIRLSEEHNERTELTVAGIDVDGTPSTFLRTVKLAYNRRVVRSEPFTINLRGGIEEGTQLDLELEFMGHYGEPNLQVSYCYNSKDPPTGLHLLEYNPTNGEWKDTELQSLPPRLRLHNES